jgi:hypothetical protein
VPDDLDDFLRRAAQQRKKRRPAEIVILEPGAQQPPRAAPPPAAPKPLPEIVEAPPLTSGSVSDHVASHLNTRHFDSQKFADRAAHLGEDVDQADEHLEAHLQQVFDHRVGKLTDEAIAVTQDDVPPMAAIVHELLRSPEDLQRAIILNELLTPRFGQWS